MRRILENLKPYKLNVVLVMIMLIIQAYGELALPQYTSDIVDVGIQNQGVESILPTRIRREDMDGLISLMNEEESGAFKGIYTLVEDTYTLTDMTAEKLAALEDLLLVPFVMASGGYTNRESAEDVIHVMGDTTVRTGVIRYTAGLMSDAGADIAAIQHDYLVNRGLMMILITLITAADSILAGLFAARIGAGVGRDLRQKTFESVMRFSGEEIGRFTSSSLITRCTGDIQLVSQTTAMLLRMIIYAPILGIGGVINIIMSRAGMGIYIAAALALILVTLGIILGIALPKMKIMQRRVDDLNRVSREQLTGIQVIRTFGREKTEEDRFEVSSTELKDITLFTNRTMTFMMPVTYLILYIMQIVIIWAAAKRIDMGIMQVGSLMAFLTYAVLIVTAFVLTTMWSVSLPRAFASAERIAEVNETVSSIADAAAPKDCSGMKGVVEFKDVSFRFKGADEDVLSHISFTIHPGEVTAVIGSTGSGKSTLAGLIPRLHDVTGGSVLIDGTDIRDMPLSDLRHMIGFVPQKALLFAGTIEDNIRFGNPKASDEDIREAISIAQAEEFVDSRPEGLSSIIAQGGSNVSGGQKQRLSIARALAGRHAVYVFDDSFSALDMKTDVMLRMALKERTGESSVLIIAQRISTITDADNIIVLDEGRIVGQGRHWELINNCEVYRQIARSQMSDEELRELNKGGVA